MAIFQRLALLGAITAALAVAAGAYITSTPANAGNSLGGPVILGGDDLQDHGCNDGAGNNEEGWLYLQRALENIDPNVSRGNDGTIAALGSADVAGAVQCGNAGSAIFHAAEDVSLTVEYFNGGPAITQFFADLEAGNVTPKIIWIAGTGSSNDLGDDVTEPAALTANAQSISDFVAEGGGLMSHGSEYGWLFALLPDASSVSSGGSGDLYFTPEGTAALPGLGDTEMNSNPWHSHFEGDFGGLAVLVRSNLVDDVDLNDAAVILGGAQVTFEEQPEEDEEEEPTPCIPPLIGYRCDGNSSGGGTAATATPAAGEPTPAPTSGGPSASPVAPAPTSPSGGQGGVISAPDTGDGTGGGPSGSSAAMLIGVVAAGVALAGAGAARLCRLRAR